MTKNINIKNICTVFQNEVYQTVTKSSIKLMIGNLKKGIETKWSATLNKIDDWEFRDQQSTPLYVAKRTISCCLSI